MICNKTYDIPLVLRDNVELFTSMFNNIDANIYGLLRAATIPNDIYNANYEYLPESCLKNLLEVLAQHLDGDRLSKLLLRLCQESFVPLVLVTISNTSSLKDALEQLCNKLKNESTAANIYLEQKSGAWWLIREKKGTEEAWFKYGEMFSVFYMTELLSALTDNQWSPNRIGVQSPCINDLSKSCSLAQAQFFIKRPVTAVEISEELILSPVTIDAPIKRKKIMPYTNNLCGFSFKRQFEFAITPYLSMGKLPIKDAARILRMNVRTLQRRLSSEGVVYKKFIEELVFQEVAYHLRSNDESITNIAIRFGYSDSAHFSRTFKRIFNKSPSTYRKQSKY